MKEYMQEEYEPFYEMRCLLFKTQTGPQLQRQVCFNFLSVKKQAKNYVCKIKKKKIQLYYVDNSKTRKQTVHIEPSHLDLQCL